MGIQPYLRFVAATQHLYEHETVQTVAGDLRAVTGLLEESAEMVLPVREGAVATTETALRTVCNQAEEDAECAGVIVWNRRSDAPTAFERPLRSLTKPYIQVQPTGNTQARLRPGGRQSFAAPIILGSPRAPDVAAKLGSWSQAVIGRHALRQTRVVQLVPNSEPPERLASSGDEVVEAVSERELAEALQAVSSGDAKRTAEQYLAAYPMVSPGPDEGEKRAALEEQARIELALLAVLSEHNSRAFTLPARGLSGLEQTPILAIQRLMGAGYGFAPAGDWRTALLLRAFKTMGSTRGGGASFLDDHTYVSEAGGMLSVGAHTLAICPSIAASAPSLKARPGTTETTGEIRLALAVVPQKAVTAALVATETGSRLVCNNVDLLPSGPASDGSVAFEPIPSRAVASACWVRAGARNHLVVSTQLSMDTLEMTARIAGMDHVMIDVRTTLRSFRRTLRTGAADA